MPLDRKNRLRSSSFVTEVLGPVCRSRRAMGARGAFGWIEGGGVGHVFDWRKAATLTKLGSLTSGP